MKRGKKYIFFIVALIAIEITLIKSVPVLKSYAHPLLSSLTCIETEDIRDLYWNINQIELSGNVNREKGNMKYDFRFEKYGSPKVEWLRQYTLPLVVHYNSQWGKYVVLGKWVRAHIPFKDPVMKSYWDAQRILQAVWKDSAIGFICDAYAATYVSACISVGLNARMLHLESVEGSGHSNLFC